MTGIRNALIVATGAYRDERFRQLRAPAADAERLASVLRDPAVGDFRVEVALDEVESVLRRRIARFFARSDRDDVLLLHVSGHGVKDAHGGLYLAAVDTEMDLLDATSLSAAWLDEQISRSPSRHKLLLLDCCFSGRFPFSATARAGDSVDVQERFQGRGRAVITASTAMEYAYEGDELSGEGQPSYFTAALVEGLETGEADLDQDQWVSVDELYNYVFERVKDRSPNQTPTRQIALEGPLYVARSSFKRPIEPATLDQRVVELITNPVPEARLGAIDVLERLLTSTNAGVVLAARQQLERMVDDDSRRVAERSAQVLEEQARREAEEQARREAEEQARREAEEQARREAEEQARREAEEQARREAEEQARREAEEQARREAEEQARREAEEQARREAEEQARREAEEQARREAEEQARREAEEQARREAEEQARRDAEEQARREAEQQAAPGEVDIVAKKAMPKKPDDSHDLAGDLEAAAIAGTGSRVHAEPPKQVAAVPAPQNIERERTETERKERETSPRERPPKEASPARPRSYRLPARAWILVLAAGALAAALAALLIAGSQHKPPATSPGGGSGAVPARWQPLSQPLPKPVQAAGVAWYRGKLWVVGGARHPNHQDPVPVRDVYAYDPVLKKWLSRRNGVPQLLEARAHAAVVSTGGSLYVIGGLGPGGGAVQTVFRLDEWNGRWHTDEQLPEARQKGAAAWDGTQIIFAGGNPEQPGKDDVWALKPGGQWTRIGKLHQDREDLAAATDGMGRVWFVGGKNTPNSTASRFVDVVRNNKVTRSLPDVSPITGAAAVGVRSGFCTIGGNTKPAGTSTAYLTGQVRCQPPARFPALPTPTNYLGATITGHTVYVVGGYTRGDTVGTRTAEKLDMQGG